MNLTLNEWVGLLGVALAVLTLTRDLGDFKSPVLAGGILVLTALTVSVFVIARVRRPEHSSVTGQIDEAARLRAKRYKGERAFHELYMRYRELYQEFEVAPDDAGFDQAAQKFEKWLEDCVRAINEFFGLGEAQAFVELGPRQAVIIVSKNPDRSAYRWSDKSNQLQQLQMYGVRVAEFLKRTSTV